MEEDQKELKSVSILSLGFSLFPSPVAQSECLVASCHFFASVILSNLAFDVSVSSCSIYTALQQKGFGR